MQYVRFWIRSVVLLVPVTFAVLYFGSRVPLRVALQAVAIEALVGIVTVIPLVFLCARVDRSLWSDDAYADRLARKRARIQELRRLREQEERRQDPRN